MKRFAWTAAWIGLLVAGCNGGGPSGEPCALDEDCGPCEACVDGHCQASAPSEECGDDLDNDCDGATDEGCAECGNQDQEEGEACDDGNTADGDYCSADCQTVTGRCGDGTDQDNEVCDLGTETAPAECQVDLQTDPDHCGFCERACPAGFECFGGACLQELASGQADPRYLEIDAGFVYWTTGCTCDLAGNSNHDGTLMRVAKEGGIPEPLLEGQREAGTIVLDQDDIYLLIPPSSLVASDGSIVRISKAGGQATPILSDAAPIALALDADYLYWAEQSGEYSILKRARKDGTDSPVELFSIWNFVSNLQVDAQALYFLGYDMSSMDVVYRWLHSGGDPENLDLDTLYGMDFRQDETDLYIHHRKSGMVGNVLIKRFPKDGTAATNVVLEPIQDGCSSYGLRSIGELIVWAVKCENTISFRSAPKSIGAVEEITEVPHQGVWIPFTADDGFVYYASRADSDGNCPQAVDSIYRVQR